LDALNLALVFGAGLASVASPCVLPMVPILVTGTAEEHGTRPLFLVLGISVSFMAMGVASSLFGGAVAPVMPVLEKATGVLVILLGLLMLLDVNVFKHLGFLQRIRSGGRGVWSGLLLGLSLGLVWVPCVGPILSAVLGLVATRGSLPYGVLLLLVYSAGFAVPMLAMAYGSQALRQRIRAINRHPRAIRWVSGLLLVGFGVYILQAGLLVIGAGF
jgi:cytochrome c-type biogenesis protein